MSWVKEIVEFIEDNSGIIKEHLFLFVVWTILCIGLSLVISSWNNKRLKNRITLLKEENAELKAEKDALFIKYSALEKKYRSMDLKTRLLQGVDEFPGTTAKIMSKNVMNSDWSKKQIYEQAYLMITRNDTRKFLWKRLETGTAMEDLVHAMLEEYDVDEQTSRSGAEHFVNKLQERGFLEQE